MRCFDVSISGKQMAVFHLLLVLTLASCAPRAVPTSAPPPARAAAPHFQRDVPITLSFTLDARSLGFDVTDVRWASPKDAAPAFVISARGPSVPRKVRLELGSWMAVLTASPWRSSIPAHVLDPEYAQWPHRGPHLTVTVEHAQGSSTSSLREDTLE
ncbi:hypothetical protein FGE12_25120 [Aggregicoccus sp. 17bor-14]|uniref:hypothetical protein n=1 Tax=Myxococcaceae TaxID=31 RepID=UPI00129D2114|nr:MULTISPECIES: hypothetical protein [Myxococcaceae]MBF5045713.1 hypothetical protein [Simulacricoccus sp. 17bor-14]MRI91449.1 hypothetical protein [Aggregicoccus sp. 17bor-14]